MPLGDNRNNFLLSYTGSINSDTMLALLAEAENKFSCLNSPDIKKRILEIMTELLQNIAHHGVLTKPENKEYANSFLLEKREGGFIITTANLIGDNKITSLGERIENLNSCSSEELKSQYQNQLRNGKLAGENAGLGLIDIIRKSGNLILFKFAPADNNYSLFTVKVLV